MMNKLNSITLTLILINILFHIDQLSLLIQADDVVGCGGFVVSSVSINYEPIKINLYTDRGIIKYISDCAPNNGYYFIPLYDMGKYVLRIKPPLGWIFDPSEVEFNFDGKNDLCSKQVDINFVFKGFTIFGKMFSLNSSSGPKGVQVTLRSKANNNIIKKNVTTEGGFYEFVEVLPGQYIIEASHERWNFIKNQIVVNVIDDNIDHRQVKNHNDQLCLLGYSATGKVVSDARPIRGVQFALFGQKKPSISLGCNSNKPNFISKLKTDTNYHYLCHTTSNEQGQFSFMSLPNGKYSIYSYYDTQNIRFEVKPHKFDFETVQDDLDLGTVFEIGGFSIFGQVSNILNPEDEIKNARVKVIDENGKYEMIEVNVNEPQGKFAIKNIKTSNYLIQTSAEGYQFDDIKFLISPNSPNLPAISPSKYEICGKILFKNFEYKYENIELLVLEKATNTLKESFIMESDNFCFFLPGGKYSLQMNTKYTNLKFLPSTLELNVNKPKIDIVFEQMTVTLKGLIKLKSPLDDEPDFLTVIFSNSKSILKTIQIEDLVKLSELEYQFILDNLLPGEYFVKLGGKQMNYFCWQENVISVNINDNKVENVAFRQKGFLLQVTLSHASDLIIKSPGKVIKEITKDSISKERLVKYCAEEVGKYQIEPVGCHKFFSDDNSYIIFDSKTMAGQMISLTALQHLVTAKIITTTNITDLQVIINLKSNEGEKNFVIPIKNSKKNEQNNFEYDLEFYENSMSDINIEPRCSQLIFKPTFYRFQLKDDCYQDIVTFHGRPGIFVKGKISQNIPDVKITVYDNETNQILQTVNTDQEGKYQAGPFDDELQLKIEAFKEDFVFKELPDQKGYFEVSKLSSIITNIVDEDGNPLTEVLVSISGGENNFRRNSFVNSEGKLVFDNLHSGQYFIRFLRKEYNFEPSSKMLNIENGENIVIKVVGKKVAFSCIGLVDSLNGEPEPGVIVEAVGIRNIENSSVQCTQLQEQSFSESDGSFRILGLLPDCQYVIRLKSDYLKNKNISKSLPKAHSIRVQNKDLTDLRFIVIYKSFQMDLTVSILIDEEYLNSVSIKLFRENEPSAIYKQTLSSPFVLLPSILLDNRTYTLQLECNLDRRNYDFQTLTHTFSANQNYLHFDFDFPIHKHSQKDGLNEQELTSNSIYSIFLFLICLAIYNYKQVQEYMQKTPINLRNISSLFTQTYHHQSSHHHQNDNSLENGSTNSSYNGNGANKNKKMKSKKNN